MDNDTPIKQKIAGAHQGRTSLPPSMIKLAHALEELLREKDFNSISAAELSRTAMGRATSRRHHSQHLLVMGDRYFGGMLLRVDRLINPYYKHYLKMNFSRHPDIAILVHSITLVAQGFQFSLHSAREYTLCLQNSILFGRVVDNATFFRRVVQSDNSHCSVHQSVEVKHPLA